MSLRLYILLRVQSSWKSLGNRGPCQDLRWWLYFWDRINRLSFSRWNCCLCFPANWYDAQQVPTRHRVHQLLNYALNKFAYNIMEHQSNFNPINEDLRIFNTFISNDSQCLNSLWNMNQNINEFSMVLSS